MFFESLQSAQSLIANEVGKAKNKPVKKMPAESDRAAAAVLTAAEHRKASAHIATVMRAKRTA